MPESADPYLYPGTDVLRNLADIHERSLFETFEANATSSRLVQLGARGVDGSFDTAHLRAIHRFVFQDVFVWAGLFCVARFIEPFLGDVMSRLANDRLLDAPDRAQFANRAGYYLGEINAVHPFREGNGRVQREFIRQLALQKGHRIRWDRIDRLQMTNASIQSFQRGDTSAMASLLLATLDV